MAGGPHVLLLSFATVSRGAYQRRPRRLSCEAVTKLLFRKEYSPPSVIDQEEGMEALALQGSGPIKPVDAEFSPIHRSTVIGSSTDEPTKHKEAGRTDWNYSLEESRPAIRLQKAD